MKCDSPVYVRRVKGCVDTPWIPVPCGQCLSCRMRKSKEWACRVVAENGLHSDSCFITLTYNDEHLPHSLDKKVLQDFLKRFRKELSEQDPPKKIRFFACGEYGSETNTLRPHYHLLVFGLSKYNEVFRRSALSELLEGHKGFWATLDSWSDEKGDFGNVFVGDVTPKSANYVAGYVLKKQRDMYHDNQWYKDRGLLPPFVVMSRRPGIGAEYVDHNSVKLKYYPYMVLGSQKIGFSRYIRDRLYGDDHEHKVEMMKHVRKELEEGRAEARRQGMSFEMWLDGQRSQRELNIATKLNLTKKGKI